MRYFVIIYMDFIEILMTLTCIRDGKTVRTISAKWCDTSRHSGARSSLCLWILFPRNLCLALNWFFGTVVWKVVERNADSSFFCFGFVDVGTSVSPPFRICRS